MQYPRNLYAAEPKKRVAALTKVTAPIRDSILAGFDWPTASPGSINAWLVFIGPSPGASPGSRAWDYDPKPAFGGPHLGVSEYEDANGFWNGIRKFTRAVFPELSEHDGYAQTMLRNLDTTSSATAPTGRHMSQAAQTVLEVLNAAIRPRLIVAIGGARTYTDPVFRSDPRTAPYSSGILFTSKQKQERKWLSLSGRWISGEPFLYVSPSGIHPSLPHVSTADSIEFLGRKSHEARQL